MKKNISDEDRERLKRQPRWVQRLVERLIRDINHYYERTRSILDYAETRVRINVPSHFEQTYLPDDVRVEFRLGDRNRDRVEVYMAEGGLHIRTSGSTVNIAPVVGNAVVIRCGVE